MNRIEEFDKLYGEVDRDWVLADTLINCILLPLMILSFALPIYEFTGDDKVVLIMPIMLFLMIMNIKLIRYIQVKEKGKVTNIYAKLKYIPVEPKDIFRVRLQYLWRYCKKYTIWALIAQLIGSVVFRQFSIWSFVYVIGCGALVYGVFYLNLLPRGRERL